MRTPGATALIHHHPCGHDTNDPLPLASPSAMLAEVERLERLPCPACQVKGGAVAPSRSTEREADFQRRVTRLARENGWLIYHTHNSEHSPAGFPDLVMVRAGGGDGATPTATLIFAELKTSTGKASAAQQTWLNLLRLVPGVGAYLWRPGDMDEIVEVLR